MRVRGREVLGCCGVSDKGKRCGGDLTPVSAWRELLKTSDFPKSFPLAFLLFFSSFVCFSLPPSPTL